MVVALALAIASTPIPTLAGPAAQNVINEFDLPGGGTLNLRLWGDEYVHGWETVDGYSVLHNAGTGAWEYATRDASGALISSGRRVGIDAAPEAPHLRPTSDAVEAARSARGAVSYRGSGAFAAPPWANGTTNVLFIMVEFPADAGDPNGAQPAVSCTFTAAQTQANLFGGTATGPGNMADYYDEISFGALDLVGTVVGCFTVANDKNDYDDGPSNEDALVTEAIALADPSVDFSSFDNDGNGEVDMVAVIYAGNGPDNGNYTGADPNVNNLWPHAGSIAPVAVDGGARTVSQYYMAPELLSATRIRTIGVHAHEFGHKLGLPDLYDTDGSSQGVGHWCLMGSGSWASNNPGFENGEAPSHMSAWCKWFLGWITPTDLTGDQVGQNIPQAETNAFAVRLLDNPGGPDDWPGAGEYFLIENRQQTGFDVGLDGCGILVWHIDEALGGNAAEGHTAGSHRLVDLEEAHGGTDLDIPEPPNGAGNRGDAGDPFPGSGNVTEWDDDTSPHSRLYNGDPTGIRMAVLTAGCAANMLASFGNEPPVADAGDDIVAECTSHTTTPVALDGTDSSDPDGDPLTYSWSSPGIVFDDPTSPTPTGQFPLGAWVVTLTVSDAIETDSDQVLVTVQDTTDPVITCPADIVVECTSHGGTPADDPQLAPFFAGVSATDVCDPDPAIADDAPDFFNLGDTDVTFTATDESGNDASCTARVTVVDTTPPVITVELDRYVLWPPNHKLVTIHATVTVEDICDPNPTFVLTSITSDEADEGLGDGDKPDDIQGDDLGTPDLEFKLRSERSGLGDGRVYTIVYTASDMSDNTADAVVEVTVPHHRSGNALASLGYNSLGTELDSAEPRFALVLLTVIDDPVSFDATRVTEALVGNTAGALRPVEVLNVDADADGHEDLAIFYPTQDALAIKAGSDVVDGPLGLHYRTEDGTPFLVPDIFALGAPIDLDGAIGVDLPDDREPGILPRVTALTGVHPNPSRASAIVSFTLAAETDVEIGMYDSRGALVRKLVDGTQPAGGYGVEWDGRDLAGQRVASGVYFVRMRAGELESMRKVILLQ
jgi:M6 family metalloprotease-like protein